MESDNAALRMSALISMSTMTLCLTCRSQSKMPMIASVLSARRKILSMCSRNPCSRNAIRSDGAQFPICPRANAEAVMHAGRQSHASCQCDHCPIVRAELGARKIQLRSGITRHVGEPFAQENIGADPAGNDQAPMAREFERAAAFLGEGVDHRLLETARDVRSDRVVQNAA